MNTFSIICQMFFPNVNAATYGDRSNNKNKLQYVTVLYQCNNHILRNTFLSTYILRTLLRNLLSLLLYNVTFYSKVFILILYGIKSLY